MHSVGIDLHRSRSHVAVIDGEGDVLLSREAVAQRVGTWVVDWPSAGLGAVWGLVGPAGVRRGSFQAPAVAIWWR
jgi:hypothetical protein